VNARDREQHGATVPDEGIWQGRQVAGRHLSPDGLVVLVGLTARGNDLLSLKLAAPRDFWLHAAGVAGAHVVVRNPENLDRLPRETLRHAAALAAAGSKQRHGGQVAVHVCRCADVSKPRGLAPGKVEIRRYVTIKARPST